MKMIQKHKGNGDNVNTKNEYNYYDYSQNINYTLVNNSYWENVKQLKDSHDLSLFYTKTASNLSEIAVANNIHIENSNILSKVDTFLSKNQNTLVKILSRGGEGKTTFLYMIAKKYYLKYQVIILKTLNFNTIKHIISHGNLKKERDVLFLIDNFSTFSEDILDFNKSQDLLKSFKIKFILFERKFRYDRIENKIEFEYLFDRQYFVNYQISENVRIEVLKKLLIYLNVEFIQTPLAIKNLYYDNEKSTVEVIFIVIRFLKDNGYINYKFDWEDWFDAVNKSSPEFKNMFLFIATFFQFGNSVNISIVSKFLNIPKIEIIDYLGIENIDYPIIIEGNNIFLRHELIAKWFFEYQDTNNNPLKNQNISIECMDWFTKNLFSILSEKKDLKEELHIFIDLLIHTYRKEEFRHSFLKNTVKVDQAIIIFELAEKLLINNIKISNELGKCYFYKGDLLNGNKDYYEKAKKVFERIKNSELGVDDVHSRNELGKVLQKLGQFDKAERVLLEIIEVIQSTHYQSRNELAKVYQFQGRLDDAENILLEVINNLHKRDFHARTELGIVYQKKADISNKHLYLDKAEKILLEARDMYANHIHSRTELGKVYRKKRQFLKSEEMLLEAIKLDKESPYARGELIKTYEEWGKPNLIANIRKWMPY